MRLMHSNLPTDRFLAQAEPAQVEDSLDVNLSQCRFRITHTLNSGAVPLLINSILLNGSPLKILERVVRSVPVQMPGLEAFRAFTFEGFQHQPVHQSRMLYAVKS